MLEMDNIFERTHYTIVLCTNPGHNPSCIARGF